VIRWSLAMIAVAIANFCCGKPPAIAATQTKTVVAELAALPAVAVITPPRMKASAGIAAIAGSWTVTAVRLTPGDVQALVPNDPSDMGAVLDISADQLAWRPRQTGTFGDACTAPQLTGDGQIVCGTTNFGPPGARLSRHTETLTLAWYDGAILELTRVN